MFKPTKATKYIHAAANRLKAAGVCVEVDKAFGWVTISCEGEESIFMQGDDAGNFIDEIEKLCKRFPSLSEAVAELALAEPYTDLWS